MTKPTEGLAVTPSQARALMNDATQLRFSLEPQPNCEDVQCVEHSDGVMRWWPRPIKSFADEKPFDIHQPGERLFVAEDWWCPYEGTGGLGSDEPEPIYLADADLTYEPEERFPAAEMPKWAARMLVTIKAAAIERNEVGEWEVVYDVEVERR